MRNEINNTSKKKTKKDYVIELYNAGEKSLKVLSGKVGVTVRSVSTFLYEARKEGRIEKEKTRIEQVSELYNSGYKDVKIIAEKLGVKVEVANNYLNKAEKMGKIEKRPKDKTKIEQVIELYNAGENNRKIIAEKVGSTIGTVSNYIEKARKEGRIERKPKTKKEQIIELYNAGEKDPKVIAEKVGSTVGTVSNYLYKAQKEGKIKNKKEESSAEENLKDKVKILLETKYPREIAKQIKVPPIMVYDVIDSLDKDYINKLKIKKVKNNPLYPQIAYLREAKNSSIENALYTLVKTNLSLDDKINLAKIYYILGNENVPERLLNEVIFEKTASLEIINRAEEEREKILLEIKSRKIREELKKERNISVDYLCKKYNVRTGFLTDLIGTGHENVISSEPCI